MSSFETSGQGTSRQSSPRQATAAPRDTPLFRDRLAVLFVGAFPSDAPLSRYVSGDLAERLVSGHCDTWVTSRHLGRLARLADILMSIWRLRASYDVACVDVFSGPAFAWAEAACALLRRLRKPYVVTLHGGNLPPFSRRHPVRVSRLMASAAAVTCPSSYLHTEMRPFRDDLILIPNGIDLGSYRFRLRHPPLSNLLWLRAFHDIYNPEMAVWAVHHLRSPGCPIRLNMIGPDKGDGSLQNTKSLAVRLGLTGDIGFRGPIPKKQVPGELGCGDVFLNTSNFDNTPVSVLEALACGLPVVSTNVGGIPYLLEHSQTAMLVRPGDAVGMAAAVMRLFAEPVLAAQLGENGRKLAESFDWSVVLPQWHRLLTEVASRNGSIAS